MAPLSTIVNGVGNVTTASSGAANNVSLAKPANVVDGDLLVAFVMFRNSGGTVTTPSGWTQLGPANTTNETFSAYYKAVPNAAAETATTYAFSTSAGTSRAAGVLARVPGIDLTSIADAAGALAVYTGTTSVVLPAVTAVKDLTLLMGFAINNTTTAASAFTAPGTMTTIGTATGDQGGGVTATAWGGAQILSATGTTGTRSPTMSPAAGNSGGFMVTLSGIKAVVPAATVVPDQVVSSVGWAANSGTILAAVGDGSDTTYVESGILTGTDQTVRFGLPALIDSPAGVRLKLRCALDVSAVTVVTVNLYQTSTLLKSWTIAPDLLTDTILTASAAEVAGVTDWSALEIEIKAHI